jgi:hypothetical protein
MSVIVHKINNEEFVLIKVPVSSDRVMLELNEAVNEFECIIQNFEVMTRSLFSSRVKISVLVPAKNVFKFNDKMYK